ncbi:MAG: 6-carboxytetrahydropterin synthase [Capsulimonadales bacterium]|nr:6-carboxytetrahydropterin synthase [Capsulimonadales bacterium]
MARIYLRRRVTFAAGHAYWLPNKTEAENRALFGRWAGRYGHGHNYAVEVTVVGTVDERTGMVVNITDVDRVLKQQVTGPLADRHLTYEVPHFADTPPTLENIARYVSERFTTQFQDERARLARVVVEESPTLWATLDQEKHLEMIALTRAFDFAAAHRLHAPALSEEENVRVFGKCNNPRGHGHNYGVEVTVLGTPDPVTGMIVDLAALDETLEREVMQRFDHKHLNDDTPDFATVNPTSENLTIAIWKHLEGRIPAPARLYRVVVRETERNFFEYYGE